MQDSTGSPKPRSRRVSVNTYIEPSDAFAQLATSTPAERIVISCGTRLPRDTAAVVAKAFADARRRNSMSINADVVVDGKGVAALERPATRLGHAEMDGCCGFSGRRRSRRL